MTRLINYIRKKPHLCYLLFVPVFLLCFFSLEAIIGPEQVRWWVYSPLDELIPFWEGFVIAYYLWYPLLAGTGLLLLILDVPNFKKYMQFLIFGFGAALFVCLIIPNGQALRPESFPRDNLLTDFVALMYSMDTPTNVFPSMHVIGSVAAAATVCKSERLRQWRLLWIAAAAAVCLSTVFIKQHSILDVLGGLVFGGVIYWWLYRGKRKLKGEIQ